MACLLPIPYATLVSAALQRQQHRQSILQQLPKALLVRTAGAVPICLSDLQPFAGPADRWNVWLWHLAAVETAGA